MKLLWATVICVGITGIAYAIWRYRRHKSAEPYYIVKTMEQHADGSWTDPVLHSEIAEFIGKHLVIAVRYPQSGTQELVHFYGPIERINEQDGIVISKSDGSGEFAVPPRAFLVEEHQRETRPTSMAGPIRPDFSTFINLDGPPRLGGWNRTLDRQNTQ